MKLNVFSNIRIWTRMQSTCRMFPFPLPGFLSVQLLLASLIAWFWLLLHSFDKAEANLKKGSNWAWTILAEKLEKEKAQADILNLGAALNSSCKWDKVDGDCCTSSSVVKAAFLLYYLFYFLFLVISRVQFWLHHPGRIWHTFSSLTLMVDLCWF